MLPKDFFSAIHSGKCVALIGSGPSCEAGLPSWRILTEKLIEDLSTEYNQTDKWHQANIYLGENKYDMALGILQDLIGRVNLYSKIRGMYVNPNLNGEIYSILSKWPFVFYMTTNYDDILSIHLKRMGLYFTEIENVAHDLNAINVNTKNVIVKLHGNLLNEQSIVTNSDYEELVHSAKWMYYRNKLTSIFSMFRVIIIGHSLYDPDLQWILEKAKELSLPTRPIYMLLADADEKTTAELYQKYNIFVTTYKTINGSHKRLVSLLKCISPFISSREQINYSPQEVDENRQINLATSLYIYSTMSLGHNNGDFIPNAYANIIFQGLQNLEERSYIIDDILDATPIGQGIRNQMLANQEDIEKALGFLVDKGYIIITNQDSEIMLTSLGKNAFETTKRQNEIRKDTFIGQLKIRLLRIDEDLSQSKIIKLTNLLIDSLDKIFSRRGLDIAQSIFIGRGIELQGNFVIFEELNNISHSLKDSEERIAFLNLYKELLLEPDEIEKEFLGAVSQGYFSYHALGLNKDCSKLRLEVAKQIAWIVDSSILIPLLADGSISNNFAVYIVDKCKELGLKLYTTTKLVREAFSHAAWGIANFRSVNPQSIDFHMASIGQGGYKQNLFLDGFIKTSDRYAFPSFIGYMEKVEADSLDRMQQRIKQLGIDVVDFSEWAQSNSELFVKREDITQKIIQIRNKRGTFKNEEQCHNEAEVIVYIETLRSKGIPAFDNVEDVYFVSQSGAINDASIEDRTITWKPEAFLRYISMLDCDFSALSLHEIIIQDYFSVGYPVIDRHKYNKFFAPLINQSKLNLKEEILRHKSRFEDESLANLETEITSIDPLYLPEAVLSTSLKLVELKKRRNEASEIKTRLVETRQLTTEEYKEYVRLKAKETARHKKNIKNKRRAKSKKKK